MLISKAQYQYLLKLVIRFDRVVDLLGEKTHNRLLKARIAVIGLGGVGCHAAIALARCGAGTLKLIDFDLLTETSLNRNPIAGYTYSFSDDTVQVDLTIRRWLDGPYQPGFSISFSLSV